jgi:branched-subunit amino acid transport protein
MAEDERRIDWEGLATRALDTAIVVIGNRVQGIRTPTAGGVSVSPTSVNVWSSQNMMPYILGGMAIIAAVMIFKK